MMCVVVVQFEHALALAHALARACTRTHAHTHRRTRTSLSHFCGDPHRRALRFACEIAGPSGLPNSVVTAPPQRGIHGTLHLPQHRARVGVDH